ncbi:MAG: carbohydrate kinase family protein [Bilophila sp.]
MSMYVSGSLAFDRIMAFGGKFSDHILADKLHILNVSFFINSLVEKRGGCAGNIAYTLALMGEKPLIVAAAGKNFTEYATFLQDLGLPLDGIRILPHEFTAECTLITDQDNNQINGFYPAAMQFPCTYPFSALDATTDWGIVSPGNFDDMQRLPQLFREKGVRYIYDPGQQIPALSGAALLDAITGSALLVTNDYELEMICKTTSRTRAELRALTGGIITTLGGQGSTIDNGASGTVGIATPVTVADPTGAGDAYRSGLLKGLTHGLDITTCARLGATCASFCVEHKGTQEHTFTCKTFAARYTAAFGADLPVTW